MEMIALDVGDIMLFDAEVAVSKAKMDYET